MASSLISGAISIILILVAGYVIATGLISIAETSIATQTEMNHVNQKNLQSVISINNVVKTGSYDLTISAANNGTTSYTADDLSQFVVFIGDSSGITGLTPTSVPVAFSYSILDDLYNLGMWDEGETVEFTAAGLSLDPKWVRIVTSTGAVSSSYI